MLEGQVAVLSSGYLSANNSLDLLDSLKQSGLFRTDQYSYLLYPDKQLPGFIEKNNIPKEKIEKSELLTELMSDKDSSILTIDIHGQYHFHSSFRNAEVLEAALDALDQGRYAPLLKKERSMVLDIYEEIFDHQSFTGRSGTFFAYEGLGSIYWHMVSKLLLAVQETYLKAERDGEKPEVLSRLKNHYYEIKEGLGIWKSPEEYGAFPIDPYSHTPGSAGVQQPGMTGQVKEDIISRFGELGISVQKGCIHFQPELLSENEFLDTEKEWKLNGKKIKLAKGDLGFTLCGTPVIYRQGKTSSIRIDQDSGEKTILKNTNSLDRAVSELIFNRTSSIKSIRVELAVTGK
jgi:hypothetical protein